VDYALVMIAFAACAVVGFMFLRKPYVLTKPPVRNEIEMANDKE
jgi:hypothetical protein